MRGLLFITKILQTMANNVSFGSKEPQMVPFNSVTEKSKVEFEQFLQEVSSQPVSPPEKIDCKVFSDGSFYKLKSDIVSILDKLEPVLYSNV